MPQHQYLNYPSIFQPLQLRSGNRFRSLSKHYFTALEKVWICSMVAQSEKKCFKVCKHYNLPVPVIKEWIDMFVRNEPFCEGYCVSIYIGSPVDAIGMSLIQDFILNNYDSTFDHHTEQQISNNNSAEYREQLKDLINTQIYESFLRRNS